MRGSTTRYRVMAGVLTVLIMPSLPALAEVKATAKKCLTIQPTGLRQGEAGSRYLNVEGTKNDKYTSFCVLVFEVPKGAGEAGDVGRMTLRLHQSIARFSKDGKVRFFLAEPAGGGGDVGSDLKFEPGQPGGVPKGAFKALHPVGAGSFKKVETGHADTFELKPDEDGRRLLAERLKAGGTILIVAVPDDEEVAATYFGAGAEEEGSRPSLSLGGDPAK